MPWGKHVTNPTLILDGVPCFNSSLNKIGAVYYNFYTYNQVRVKVE